MSVLTPKGFCMAPRFQGNGARSYVTSSPWKNKTLRRGIVRKVRRVLFMEHSTGKLQMKESYHTDMKKPRRDVRAEVASRIKRVVDKVTLRKTSDRS